MRRRDLIFLIGGVLLPAASRVATAQPPVPVHRIGGLAQDLQPGLLENFRAGLHDFGYDEGRNVTIEVRDAESHNDRLPGLIADLLRLKVDVILAVNTPSAKAAAEATKTVPIIIMRVADPVKAGLIASLGRPGGNITGLYFMPDVLTAKAIEMLREALPDMARVGIRYRSDNSGALISVEGTEQQWIPLGLQFVRLPVRDTSEFAGAFDKAIATRSEAMVVIADGALTKSRRAVVDLAMRHRLPLVSSYRDFAVAGGLFSAGPNLSALYRRGGYFVDRILKGTAPADLPVERPTKFDLVVNLKTAMALGLTVPPSVIARADETIE